MHRVMGDLDILITVKLIEKSPRPYLVLNNYEQLLLLAVGCIIKTGYFS